MSLVQRLSEQLQQSLDANFKVTNVEAVLEIIKKLEGIPITKEQLETTRLAKFINGLRRQTTDDNLARRSKSLLRQWRALVMPTLAPSQPPQSQPAPQQHQQQPSASAASNSGSYFVNNISSIQQNGVSALGQPPGIRLPPKQPQPLPTATLTISSASSSPLMPQQLHQQIGMPPINRPYNGTNNNNNNNNNSTTNQPQSHLLNQQPVNLTMGDTSGLLKQRQNQPMNCDNNSTNNSFLLSINTTSDLSDNSQQSTRRNKSAKKEKKPKKSSGKDTSNNNFPSITSFGGVITGDGQKKVQLMNHESSLPATTTFFDGSNNAKSKALVKPAAARSLQQPFLFNGDSLSSSQSMSNFSYGGGSTRGVAANAENLSFSGHFSKVKTNTTPPMYPQNQRIPAPAAPISLVDDDVVLVNSSRSHSPFMPVVNTMTPATALVNATVVEPTPLEILVKESMTPVTTVVPVPAVEVKTPKKRGRKKGSKGIDSQLHLQNAINMPSTSAGTGGREINSYLDMKHKIDSMMPKSKKLKTTQELYAELQSKSKVASASTSTQVSPSSSSEQSMSTAVDSVASRMATPEPTSQDLFDASTSKGVRRNNAVAVKQEKDDAVAAVVKAEKVVPENIEDEISRLLGQLPPIDYQAAFEEDEEVVRAEEAEQCLCTIEVIEPEIVPTVEVEAEGEQAEVAVSITIPRAKPVLVDVAKPVKKEPPAPIKPQKQVKSIFDLDYDDDNDPIHDFRNTIQPEVVTPVDEPVVKVEIPVPTLPEAVPQPIADPVAVPSTEPVIPAPPVFQVEYHIHPECPARRIFETNPQNITKFHLDALHHQFVPNVNGNWSTLPIYVPTVVKLDEPPEGNADVKPEAEEDKLFDRVVPPYNFLLYEAIPKTHPGLETGDTSDVKLKLLLREQIHRQQQEEVDLRERERKRKFNHSESEDDGLEDVEEAPASKRVKLNDDDRVKQGGDAEALKTDDKTEPDEEVDEEAVKLEKLKELQESMALSSFLDPNYTFYYNDQVPKHQQHQQKVKDENIEVAVPFENNNLNLRINAVSDVNSEPVTEMLRMTIDDEVDIRNENYCNLTLASCNSDQIVGSRQRRAEEGVVQNGCETTEEEDDGNQTISKPDIKLLVTSQMRVKDEGLEFMPLSSLQLPDDKHVMTEFVQHLDPVMPAANNGLLPSFDNIELDVPALTSVPPIKQEPSDDPDPSAAAPTERYFREWQDCVNVRSYNDEVITLLPYVVID